MEDKNRTRTGAHPGQGDAGGACVPPMRQVVDWFREAALEVLSPTRCASCERPGALVCDRCLAQMQLIDPARACVRCGAPFGSMLCTECDGEPASLDRCLAAAVFDGPPSRIVRAYKDAGERRLAEVIARMLLDTALHAQEADPERYGGILDAADAVTFVPATAHAFRRRGFDHMDAIARAFFLLSGAPLVDALVKRGRSDQRALGRGGRRASASGAYGVVAPVESMRLLLLDDVVTTGATIQAAAAALKASGAAHVDALALARVWG